MTKTSTVIEREELENIQLPPDRCCDCINGIMDLSDPGQDLKFGHCYCDCHDFNPSLYTSEEPRS